VILEDIDNLFVYRDYQKDGAFTLLINDVAAKILTMIGSKI